MRHVSSLSRRHVLAGLTAASLAPAWAQSSALLPDSDGDQTLALQQAIDAARPTGRLSLPPGSFRISGLALPSNLLIEGVSGATTLIANGSAIASVAAQKHLTLRNIGFAGNSGSDPLLDIADSENITVDECSFSDSPELAIHVQRSSGAITQSRFSGHGDAAIHGHDNHDFQISGNSVTRCGNAGIRVWRSEKGPDGTIVTENRVTDIAWRDGGTGQNGNGINVYLADEVIIADNHISDCAFTAIRLNTTRNTIVSGNFCKNSGETAIYSEFGYSGTIIANNIVDGAAAGISIVNLDVGGELGVCTGNIVRNFVNFTPYEPERVPVGIYAEADIAVTGNVVENCPGIAYLLGWGPYLRNVALCGNVAVKSRIGIGVSIAEGAGTADISANRIDASQHQIAGMRWHDVAEPDLAAVQENYPQITIR